MSSTYSTNLALELIGTGDQSGTWGATTNVNLGTLLEQAISGYATQAVATGTDTTITIPNGTTGVARNMFLELTGTGGASTNLIVPANKKLYLVYNNTAGQVTVKVSGQTGVSVPAAAKIFLVSNGTDIVDALSYIPSLTLGAALPIASGGTGATSAAAARAALSAAVLGANGDITSLTGLTTALSVAQGGTGATSTTANAAIVGNSGGTGFSSVSPSTTGNVLTSNGTSWTSAAPASGPSAASTAVTKTGTSTTTYVTPGGLYGALGMSQIYTTGQTTLSTYSGVGGATSYTHGFGHVPVMTQAMLVCLSTDLGYSSGDEVAIYPMANDSTGGGINIKVTTTTVVILPTNNAVPLTLMPATGTGNRANIDPTKWGIYVNVFG